MSFFEQDHRLSEVRTLKVDVEDTACIGSVWTLPRALVQDIEQRNVPAGGVERSCWGFDGKFQQCHTCRLLRISRLLLPTLAPPMHAAKANM